MQPHSLEHSDVGQPAVFLDRDDTILDDPSYLRTVKQMRFLPGTARAIARLNQAGFLVVVVTNQSGIARGFLTEDDLAVIHEEFREQLGRAGAHVDAIYFCPFLPGAPVPEYAKPSNWRKPAPGMLLQAAKDLGIDLAASWMVGDGERDVQAGRAARCRTIRLTNPKGGSVDPALNSQADILVPDLPAAVEHILKAEHPAKADQNS
jgi:D-glycero-D-manno-heptose 1,7-bisphosphate phosphatase